MTDIDSLEEIKKLDEGNVLESIMQLPAQCEDAWEHTKDIEVPNDYKDITNIVMGGMGGSGLGARIIESVYHDKLKFPLIRVNNYDLPNFADHHSLVVCSSYSGTTEEVLNLATQAIARNCKWMAIGTGNKLIEMAAEHGVPYYKIVPKYNPCKQPRMAIGYSVVGQLALTSKAGLFEISQETVKEIISTMKEVIRDNNADVAEGDNDAKKLARQMVGKDIFYIASDHLVGAVHTVNNQLNENTKAFSADYQIPEINHHLMEGLANPAENQNRLFFIFANSKLYGSAIRKRFKITQEVLNKNNIKYYEYNVHSREKLTQAFELIQFGAFVNFYLGMLYNQNPTPIPWVDYFKEQLAKD